MKSLMCSGGTELGGRVVVNVKSNEPVRRERCQSAMEANSPCIVKVGSGQPLAPSTVGVRGKNHYRTPQEKQSNERCTI